MKNHSNRFLVFLGFGMLISENSSLGVLSASPAQGRVETRLELDSRVDWMQRMLAALRITYRLLGGDPANLNEKSLQSSVAMLDQLFSQDGVPDTLSLLESAELFSTLLVMYSEAASPPPNAPQFDQDAFLQLIEAIWVDAGFPIEQLTQ